MFSHTVFMVLFFKLLSLSYIHRVWQKHTHWWNTIVFHLLISIKKLPYFIFPFTPFTFTFLLLFIYLFIHLFIYSFTFTSIHNKHKAPSYDRNMTPNTLHEILFSRPSQHTWLGVASYLGECVTCMLLHCYCVWSMLRVLYMWLGRRHVKEKLYTYGS